VNQAEAKIWKVNEIKDKKIKNEDVRKRRNAKKNRNVIRGQQTDGMSTQKDGKPQEEHWNRKLRTA
jgi:hypothetical protein